MTRHLLLVAVAAIAASHTAFAQGPGAGLPDPFNPQPCPFDCLTCDPVAQTCTSCSDGFRLENGRCHLEQCDTAMAHPSRSATTGLDDASMATWEVQYVDGPLHKVTIKVHVPPRFHCDISGHALTDALNWETWLDLANTSEPCPTNAADYADGFCGPTDDRWTPVLMLGRESDDADGYINLPVGASSEEPACTSAYRNLNDQGIQDTRTASFDSLVSSFDDATGETIITLPLKDLIDTTNSRYCVPQNNLDSPDQPTAGERFKYWFMDYDPVTAITNWRFDATLCYVDSTGEQSVCPFSSPVWELEISGITDGVTITPAGVAELIYVPKCKLFIRSAQIRYEGTIEFRTATGEFEVAVTCEGQDYIPNIVDITHCECEEDVNGKCIFVEDAFVIDSSADTITTTALFKSKDFSASNRDYLQQSPCPHDAAFDLSNDNGGFVVEIAYDDGSTCTTDPESDNGECYHISNTKLFGAAPLQSTDELRELDDYEEANSHEVYAGLMKSNDLRVPTGAENYFHQFNRTYLEFTTITRVVGPDQKNSFVMCAMMQPEGYETDESVPPSLVNHEFRVTIEEVTFDIAWDPDTSSNKPNTVHTLATVLAGNSRWPAQWVWEHQDDGALRREVVSRRTGRAEDCAPGAVCNITPMQNNVLDNSNFDHIEENFDCVGVSPFYLYSLLTLNNPEHLVTSASVNLTVRHEYLGSQGPYNNRRLLQADDSPNSPFFSAQDEKVYGGAFAFSAKSDANKVAVEESPASPESSVPVMPIVLGVVAASMTCMFFAAFAFWRRRKQPTREEAKLGAQAPAQFAQPQQAVVSLTDVQLQDSVANRA